MTAESFFEECQSSIEKGHDLWKSYFSKWETLAKYEEEVAESELPEPPSRRRIPTTKKRGKRATGSKVARGKTNKEGAGRGVVVRKKAGLPPAGSRNEPKIVKQRNSDGEELLDDPENKQLEAILKSVFTQILNSNRSKFEIFAVLSQTSSRGDSAALFSCRLASARRVMSFDSSEDSLTGSRASGSAGAPAGLSRFPKTFTSPLSRFELPSLTVDGEECCWGRRNSGFGDFGSPGTPFGLSRSTVSNYALSRFDPQQRRLSLTVDGGERSWRAGNPGFATFENPGSPIGLSRTTVSNHALSRFEPQQRRLSLTFGGGERCWRAENSGIAAFESPGSQFGLSQSRISNYALSRFDPQQRRLSLTADGGECSWRTRNPGSATFESPGSPFGLSRTTVSNHALSRFDLQQRRLSLTVGNGDYCIGRRELGAITPPLCRRASSLNPGIDWDPGEGSPGGACRKTNREHFIKRRFPEMNIARDGERLRSSCLRKRTNSVGPGMENSNFITPERKPSERKCSGENGSQRERRRPSKVYFDNEAEEDSDSDDQAETRAPIIRSASKKRRPAPPLLGGDVLSDPDDFCTIFDRVAKP